MADPAYKITIDIPKGWSIVYGQKEMKALMRKAGSEVAARARALIRAKAPGGMVRASVPGQPPVSRTGALASSIKVSPWRDGEGVSIRDAAFYALFLEAGAQGGGGNTRGRNSLRTKKGRMVASQVNKTRVLAPRPFLSVALADVVAGGLSRRIIDAVTQDIDFKKSAGKP